MDFGGNIVRYNNLFDSGSTLTQIQQTINILVRHKYLAFKVSTRKTESLSTLKRFNKNEKHN